MNSLLPQFIGANRFWPLANRREVTNYQQSLEIVRDQCSALRGSSDSNLAQRADDLRNRVMQESSTDGTAVIDPACALVVEAFRRTLGIELYDVQILAGISLSHFMIAEMHTGEGKTFTAAIPAFVHSLTGRGIHVMTVNDYLAQRDFKLLRPVYELLGATVGALSGEDDNVEKKKSYDADVTYGPGYDFGFDYLRDQVLLNQSKPRLGASYLDTLRGQSADQPDPCQRGHAIAIVDEIDSVLIDEATTPLVLTLSARKPADDDQPYQRAMQISEEMTKDEDYLLDSHIRRLQLTAAGQQKALEMIADSSKGLRRSWAMYVEQALRAKHLFLKDVDYVVEDDQVRIVDRYTGRIFSDRSWNDGLQQAVEAKESVTVTAENQPFARITRQRYFRRYQKICGMTGTASTSESEFRKTYGLRIVAIPPRKQCQRKVFPTRYFADEQCKTSAIVADIVRIHQTRQPILVGTTTIENSTALASRLDNAKVPYRLLNGIQDENEASIVARAGEIGAVTIATNMAGRGTDIKLSPGVAELGGLHVIATEPQESTRIDRQLFGRAARQGDPGSCQLFVSSDDRIIVNYSPALASKIKRLASKSGEALSDLSGDLAKLQRQIEQQHYLQRRRLFDRDDWLESVLRGLAKQS